MRNAWIAPFFVVISTFSLMSFSQVMICPGNDTKCYDEDVYRKMHPKVPDPTYEQGEHDNGMPCNLKGKQNPNQRCYTIAGAKELREKKRNQAAKSKASPAGKTASPDMVAAVEYVFGNKWKIVDSKNCVLQAEAKDGYVQRHLGKLDPSKAKVESRLGNAGGPNFYMYYLVVPGQKGFSRAFNKDRSEDNSEEWPANLEEAVGFSFQGDDRKRKLDAFLFLYKQGCPSIKLPF